MPGLLTNHLLKVAIVDHDLDFKELERAVRKLIKNKNASMQVGFLKTATYKDGTRVADVARWLNYGTHRIPPRPFFNKAVSLNNAKWLNILATEAGRGKELDMKTAFNRLANVCVGDIQKALTELRSPPNKPSTIKKKGSSNPLIDTGHLRRSVTYKVMS